MNNEETIIENWQDENEQNEAKKQKRNNTWANVTLGGITGILMGAGIMHATQVMGKGKVEAAAAPAADREQAPAEETEQKPTEDQNQAEQQTGNNDQQPTTVVHHVYEVHHVDDVIYVTAEDNDLTFGEAFATARAEVGPGGAFVWHGGVYSTYYAEEWNAMTPAQRNDYANRLELSVYADEIEAPTDNNSYVDVVPVVDAQTAENFEIGDDVHVVGYTDIDGHLTVAYDTDDDGSADVAIIDMDDDHQISDPDVVFDSEGNITTISDLTNSDSDESAQNDDDAYLTSYNDNPDVAPDMPDYMDDAMIDA